MKNGHSQPDTFLIILVPYLILAWASESPEHLQSYLEEKENPEIQPVPLTYIQKVKMISKMCFFFWRGMVQGIWSNISARE